MLAIALAASLVVRIVTAMGNIEVLLDPVNAPKSTTAFMQCVDSGKLNGTTMYRTARADNQAPVHPSHTMVIQGGLNADKNPFPMVPLERTNVTGWHNMVGTFGVPRDAKPDTGSACDFYINMANNPHLDTERAKDHNGYAVFGKVVAGMDVARKIWTSPAKGQALTPPIKIIRVERIKKDPR
jgi:peptidyl-prolyl cis-trans isomerase A (cyclophilin A)